VPQGAGDREAAFGEYVAARAEAMRATAYLLCGDWHDAEDIVQTAFTKLYLAWSRVTRHEVLDAYVRRIVVRTYLDERRRGWRRERTIETLPDVAAVAAGDPEDRIVLLRALAAVPPRQRAVLVLRYWEDLDIEATARALGCSTGNVKSQTNRGLQKLRGLLDLPAGIRSDGRKGWVLDG
jgi:RNA polymerase sigma-70 factor (sigma-E family)